MPVTEPNTSWFGSGCGHNAATRSAGPPRPWAITIFSNTVTPAPATRSASNAAPKPYVRVRFISLLHLAGHSRPGPGLKRVPVYAVFGVLAVGFQQICREAGAAGKAKRFLPCSVLAQRVARRLGRPRPLLRRPEPAPV